MLGSQYSPALASHPLPSESQTALHSHLSEEGLQINSNRLQHQEIRPSPSTKNGSWLADIASIPGQAGWRVGDESSFPSISWAVWGARQTLEEETL